MTKRFWIFAFFGAEVAIVAAIRVPRAITFREFAFQDSGTNLVLQQLIARGLRPRIDFGYLYGLLPLLVGRFWFAVFGATPSTYMAAMFACGLGIAFGIADIAAALSLGAVGIIFLFAALPHAIQIGYPNFAHAIEALLLVNGIAAQARGRRDIALAFATAACFSKPSMGYIYGLVLILLEGRDLFRRPSNLAAFAAPAVITGLILTAVLSAVYGAESQVLSFSPLAGWVNYRARNFGILRAGLPFLYPHDLSFPLNIAYYAMTVAGFWIACTVWLILAGLGAAFRILSGDEIGPSDETTLTCALLQLAFIGVLWGNQWSWPYYSYLPIIGGAAATVHASQSGLTRATVVFLTVLALTGHLATIGANLILPRTEKPSPATAGLLANQQERSEWNQACEIAKGHNAVVLVDQGAVALMFPQFGEPFGAFLLPGLARPAEVEHKVRQITRAEVIVERSDAGVAEAGGDTRTEQFSAFPEIRAAMRGTRPIMQGRYFDVYVRTSANRTSAASPHLP